MLASIWPDTDHASVLLIDYPLLASLIEPGWSSTTLDRARYYYGMHWRETETASLSDLEQELFDHLKPAPYLLGDEIPTEQNSRIMQTCLALTIDPPWMPSIEQDVVTWLEWWAPSVRLAQKISDAERDAMWSAGNWPPQAPEQDVLIPPRVVMAGLRKDDQHCRNVIAAYLARVTAARVGLEP